MTINKLLTTSEIQQSLAIKFKQARLTFGHSRTKSARLSGVPAPTIRVFETKSNISLRQFLMLCHVYGDLTATEQLFPIKSPTTMDELLSLESQPVRQRGRS